MQPVPKVIHVLLFWQSDCEGRAYMLCGASCDFDEDARPVPASVSFVGDFGHVRAGEAERVTCFACADAAATAKPRQARRRDPAPA